MNCTRVACCILVLAAGIAGIASRASAQTSGTPLMWGLANTGQLGDSSTAQRETPFQVPDLTNLLAVVAGWDHVLARRSDGTVWTWGKTTEGWAGHGSAPWFRSTPAQVAGLAGVRAVAAGWRHNLALLGDGTVVAWGMNSNGQLGDGTTTFRTTPVPVQGLTGVTAVAAGGGFSLALRTDGTVWAWGTGASGQLGDGGGIDRAVPVQVSALTNVIAIGAGSSHAVAVKDDGGVWCWGFNGSGQLGDGTTVNRLVPVPVVGLAGAVQVAAGLRHTLALLSDGTVRAWGRNAEGQLGNGTGGRSLTPVGVSGLDSVTSIAAGATHGLARRLDGTVWAWGEDTFGEGGGPPFTQHLVPVQVAGISGATTVAAGSGISVALATGGTTWIWGRNELGQHGDGRTLFQTTPAFLAGVPALTTLALGWTHHLGIDASGRVWSWGNGDYGQTGHGVFEYSAAPAPVPGAPAATAIAAGEVHSVALANDGSVWAWGLNESGQLGDGTGVDNGLPVQAVGLPPVTSISAGWYHTVALDSSGAVWAWGSNEMGQIGDGTFEDRLAPIQVTALSNITAIATEPGALHTLALAADGTVWAWGDNRAGQLGDGTTIGRATPVQVSNLVNIVAIAVAAWGASFALANDGTVWSWGNNAYGLLGDPAVPSIGRATPAPVPGLTGVIAVASGDTHAIARTADGRLWAWGLNYAGELGLGDLTFRTAPTEIPGLSGVTAFFAGGDNTAVLATCELSCATDVPQTGEPAVAVPFASTPLPTSGCMADPAFEWDFGNGSPHSSAQNPTHAYASEGSFHWVLTVTLGEQTCTNEGDISIAYPCTVSCSAAAPVYVQAGAAATFTGTKTLSHCAGTATYDWDFGDGSEHSTLQDPTHTYTTAGTAAWMLTVTANGSSCVHTGQITVLGPACTGAYDLIIPAAAHSNNAWQSDLDLYNLSDSPASVDIALLKPGQANLSPTAMNVAVLPGQTLRLPDILGSLLPAANAALGIRFCSGAALVNSRFYNIGTPKSGTFGAIVPALPPSAAITPTTRGVFHYLTYSTDPKKGYRVNLGFANASPFSVSVTVYLFGDDGALIGTKTLSVRAYEQSRLDKIHQTLGTGPVTHGSAIVEVNTPNARLHAYALLIDNVSGDPAFMGVEPVPQ